MMNKSLIRIFVLSAAIVCLFPPSPADAAKYKLKNGSTLDGKILFEESGTIYLETKDGLVNIKNGDLESVANSEKALKTQKQKLYPANDGVALGGTLERIHSYHSRIEVLPDASLLVTEIITVQSTGDQIKRGIYRDFPVGYVHRYGFFRSVDFNVVEILQDGQRAIYRVEKGRSNVRIYIGKIDTFLMPGKYTYTLTYKTGRQLLFSEDHDTLYWNVTGNGWSFPMDSVTAEVKFSDVPVSQISGVKSYIGAAGSKEAGVFDGASENGILKFKAGRKLLLYEGMSIKLSWPKGHVRAPSVLTESMWFIKDNAGIFTALMGALAIFVYYLVAWQRYGRDPEPGTIQPIYEVPDNLSPAALRYIMNISDSTKTLVASLMSMIAKNAITVSQEGKNFCLRLNGAGSDGVLSKEEKLIKDILFERGVQFQIIPANANYFWRINQHMDALFREQYDAKYFIFNDKYRYRGLFLSILVLGGSALLLHRSAEVIVVMFTLLFHAIFVIVTIACARALGNAPSDGATSPRPAAVVGSQLFCFLIFLAGSIIMSFGIIDISTIWFFAANIILVLSNYIFWELLKKPTTLGLRMKEKIAGFQLYLSGRAKKWEVGAPEPSVELFEKYLPYAVALDQDISWQNRFFAGNGKLVPELWGKILQAGSATSISSTFFRSGNLAGAINGAVSSAISAAGSGGGGGGGGGGGW